MRGAFKVEVIRKFSASRDPGDATTNEEEWDFINSNETKAARRELEPRPKKKIPDWFNENANEILKA